MANYGYQYETSPRKIEPEYNHTPKKKIVKKKQVVSKRKNVVAHKVNKKIQNKRTLKFEIKILVNALCIFGILFAVMACQALVEQKYKEKENLLAEYNGLCTKINSSQEVSEDLRGIAESYGMQAKAATIINLEKEDYIESSNISEEKEKSFIEKMTEIFTGNK